MDIFFAVTFFETLRRNVECMEWPGAPDPNGYCRVKVDGKTFSAHRLSYHLKHGNIPDGMQVLHKCDNRKCCEPDHLFLGTVLDNMQDRDAKGRQARSSTHGMTQLSENSVAVIRDVYSDGYVSQRKIAEIYGVSQAAINHVIKRKNWKHLE